jgi:hypothetical protein
MLFTCYNYHSNRVTNTVIFVKDKNVINVYVNLYNNIGVNEDFGRIPLLVITEENMKKYPTLYKIYIISIFLTYDSSKLSKLNVKENGYHIRKKTIWKNLYITNCYDCEDTYMSNYPTMSYNLSTDAHVENCMYTINDVVMIRPDLISGLIEIEILKIEKELKCCEDYTKTLMMYASYIKQILPDNIPNDLAYIILEKL